MRDLLTETLRSLRAHKLRFALTSLGLVWGAFLLTYLSASTAGMEKHYIEELEEMGPKLMYMGGGTILKHRVGERGARNVELEAEDGLRMRSLDSVEGASPLLQLWNVEVRANGRTKLLNLEGVDASSQTLANLRVARGRFITPLDVERRARVAFIGARAGERIFERSDALGRELHIGSIRFRVVGIGEAKGSQLINTGNPDDLKLWIPYSTAQRWFTQVDQVAEFVLAPTVRERGGDTIRHIRQVEGLHHDFHPDVETALWFFNLYEMLGVMYAMFGAIRAFVLAAGIITLLVGSVGVMNIMLVVVAERTHEIGLRKSLGATDRGIFVQFLAEATLVSTLSGLFGAALGLGAGQLMAAMLPADAPLQSPPVFEPVTTLVLVASLIAVGIIAGVAPALRAARVPPSEALRAA